MEFEQRLHAALAPRSFGSAACDRVMARLSSAATRSRGRGRSVFWSCVLGALCAAAATLALLPGGSDKAEVGLAALPSVVVPATEPPSAAEPVAPPVVQESTESVVQLEQPENKPAATVTPILVLLSPPDAKGLDATSSLILDQFHSVVARKLAATPGVTLLSPDAVPATGLHYRISIKISGSRADGARSVSFAASRFTGEKPEVASLMDSLVQPGADIVQVASTVTDNMAKSLFPGYAATFQKEGPAQLHAQWSDPTADLPRRQAALKQLLSMVGTVDPSQRKAVYAAALDMFETEPDPVVRDEFFARVQNLISPELFEAANDALARTGIGAADPDLRRKLVSILGKGLRNIDVVVRAPTQANGAGASSPEAGAARAALVAIAPAIRDQLASIASSDPDKLNRMVATRALGGEDKWNQYVVDSLKDTTLPDVERLEGFAALAGTTGMVVKNPLLDEAAIRSAGDLIIRAARDPGQVRDAIEAVKTLAAVSGDAARDAGLKILRPGNGLSAASPVRAAMLVPLMTTKGADPAVREAVEDLARGDPDPLMRRRAGQVLQAADFLARDGKPLAMLTGSSLIESAPPAR